MYSFHLSTLIIAAAVFASACGGGSKTNQSTNGNAASNAAANRPAAVNSQPAATPATTASPAATPTNTSPPVTNTNSASPAERPRVVEQKKAAKSASPGESIPSDDEMRKAFSKPVTQEDVNNPGMRKSEPMMRSKPGDSTMMRSKPSEVPMMKSNKKPTDKP